MPPFTRGFTSARMARSPPVTGSRYSTKSNPTSPVYPWPRIQLARILAHASIASTVRADDGSWLPAWVRPRLHRWSVIPVQSSGPSSEGMWICTLGETVASTIASTR